MLWCFATCFKLPRSGEGPLGRSLWPWTLCVLSVAEELHQVTPQKLVFQSREVGFYNLYSLGNCFLCCFLTCNSIYVPFKSLYKVYRFWEIIMILSFAIAKYLCSKCKAISATLHRKGKAITSVCIQLTNMPLNAAQLMSFRLEKIAV